MRTSIQPCSLSCNAGGQRHPGRSKCVGAVQDLVLPGVQCFLWPGGHSLELAAPSLPTGLAAALPPVGVQRCSHAGHVS